MASLFIDVYFVAAGESSSLGVLTNSLPCILLICHFIKFPAFPRFFGGTRIARVENTSVRLDHLAPVTCWDLTIRSRLLSKVLDHDLHVRRQYQRKKKNFVNVKNILWSDRCISFVFCVPAYVTFTAEEFCSCFPPVVVWFGTVLQLGKAMVNHSSTALGCHFQDTLKKCWRKQV